MRLRIILLTILLGMLSGTVALFVYLREIREETVRLGLAAGQPQKLSERPPSAGSGQAFLLPVAETDYFPIRDFNIPDPVLNAKSAILFDIRSGRVLFSKNANQRLPIASITKLMSAVVVLENLNLNDVFAVPAENINVDGRGADFSKGEKLTGSDLFKIMLIKSSNDAALTLATAAVREVGINFIAEMNIKARAIGMFNTKFTDPTGLDDDGTFSTASDLLKLVNYAGKHKLISQTLGTESAVVTSLDGTARRLISTNQLFGRIPGIVWGKTGYTDGALGTMALVVDLGGGGRVVGVVLGSGDRLGEIQKLIEWGKTVYRWQ